MSILCANNALDAALKVNGGSKIFGTHDQCFKKGYARGYNQKVTEVPHFIRRWTGAYQAHIQQKLWHSDEPVPPGYQRATLAQTMGKGFAYGCMALAKKLKQKTISERPSSKQRPTYRTTRR